MNRLCMLKTPIQPFVCPMPLETPMQEIPYENEEGRKKMKKYDEIKKKKP